MFRRERNGNKLLKKKHSYLRHLCSWFCPSTVVVDEQRQLHRIATLELCDVEQSERVLRKKVTLPSSHVHLDSDIYCLKEEHTESVDSVLGEEFSAEMFHQHSA